jgi:hypothetical protein
MNSMIVPPAQPIVIVCEDPIIHTRLRPFCTRRNCPCHQDAELLAELAERVNQGWITLDESTRVYMGKQALP